MKACEPQKGLWILLSVRKHLEDCEQSGYLSSDLSFCKIALLCLRKGYRGTRIEARRQLIIGSQEQRNGDLDCRSFAGCGEW